MVAWDPPPRPITAYHLPTRTATELSAVFVLHFSTSWTLFRTWKFPIPKYVCETNSEKQQNCSCINWIVPRFLKLQLHTHMNPRQKRHVQLHKDNKCPKAENCNYTRGSNSDPHPQPRTSLLRISVCSQVSNGILTKENLVRAKTAPTAMSRTFTPLVRRLGFPQQGLFLAQNYTPTERNKNKSNLRTEHTVFMSPKEDFPRNSSKLFSSVVVRMANKYM